MLFIHTFLGYLQVIVNMFKEEDHKLYI